MRSSVLILAVALGAPGVLGGLGSAMGEALKAVLTDAVNAAVAKPAGNEYAVAARKQLRSFSPA